ncbi:MAG: YdcF family protein [Clostridiales bacterium]|nr:YdcF family protein [Clostridiales bacterium]
MKYSAYDPKRLNELTREQISQIVYGDWKDDGLTGVAALLLGGPPEEMEMRSRAAAHLYLAGRVSYVIPTGGVYHDTELGHMTEAECMQEYLLQFGVPKDHILLENEATTTRENMLFGAIQLERHLRLRSPFRVYIVTAPYHLRRSMLLARTYLPRTYIVSGYAAHDPTDGKDVWHLNPYLMKNPIDKEVHLLKNYIDNGEIEDIDF